MIKLYRLLTLHITIILVLTALHSGAQNLSIAQPSHIVNNISKKGPQQKALGDTLYYEDFSDSTLTNWNAYSNLVPAYNWIWSKSAPGGQYSGSIGPLNSSSSSNGFISLPSDLYNTAALMFDPMDSWISSNAIPIVPKPAVDLSFQHYLRYCCHQSNPIEVQVSSDSMNWTAFDAKANLAVNALTMNGELLTFNVSSVLANEDTAYIRFRMTGDSHYFWMIDDLTITEGLTNALSLDSALIDFFPNEKYKEHYSRLPADQFCSPVLSAVARNIGAYDQTGVGLITSLYNRPFGQSAYNLVYSSTTNKQTIPNGGSYIFRDSFLSNVYPASPGDFFYKFELTSDSILQDIHLSTDSSQEFTIELYDTTIARDYNQFNGKTGPSSFFNITPQDGDAWAESFEFYPRGILSFISVSVFIANDSINIGVVLQPNIWRIQADTLVIPSVGSSPFPTTINASMLGSWVTLPIFPPISIYQSGSYAIGVMQTAGAINGKSFMLGMDSEVSINSSIQTHFLRYKPTSSNSHIWVHPNKFAGIRPNFANSHGGSCSLSLTTSVAELRENSSGGYHISPNPSNGFVQLSGTQKSQELFIRDINGRLVYSKKLQKGESSLDLSSLHNGLYILHFKGKVEMIEKLVIQH